jgi:hypothetical protein
VQQADQLLTLGSGERLEQCSLGRVDPLVQPCQRGPASLGERDYVAPPVLLVGS